MKFFNQDEKSVLDALGTSAEKGLNDEQVAENRQKYGENVIAEEKKKSIFSVFLEQFADLMVIILIIASVMKKQQSAGALFRIAVYSKVLMFVVATLLSVVPIVGFSVPFMLRIFVTTGFMGFAIAKLPDHN